MFKTYKSKISKNVSHFPLSSRKKAVPLNAINIVNKY